MIEGGSILVTGANGGLGSAIVERILQDSEFAACTGIFIVRKSATATNLKNKLSAAPERSHKIIETQLDSIADVKEAAAEINSEVAAGTLPPLRAIILAAAYQDSTELCLTTDGYEATWQINFLSNFILVLSLLQSCDKQHGRIVLISSWSHDFTDSRNDVVGNAYKDQRYTTLFPDAEALGKGSWSTPTEDPSADAGYRRYGASKLCAAMFLYVFSKLGPQQFVYAQNDVVSLPSVESSFELGERLANDPTLSKVGVVGIDPGAMPTDLGRRGSIIAQFKIKIIMPLLAAPSRYLSPNGLFRLPSKSAEDTIRAAFEVDLPQDEVLYLNGTDNYTAAKETMDRQKRKELWQYALQVSCIGEQDTALAQW
ncbi:short-chain [Fusarium albosuccineum]|uniref:Short-chain n=1 Tax=Fusarium albosuccineum TaxID=1237068 RepID=A0A8H4KTW9_9HYPO|nr:short-chain [Fusarium albosuccineum]